MPAITSDSRPYETLRSPNGVDDYAAIQGAVNRLSAGAGGRLILGPGTWRSSQTIVFPTGDDHPVSLEGAGMRTTMIRRTANVILLDWSGAAGGAGDVAQGHQAKDITFSGGDTGSSAVMRLYYAAKVKFDRVRWIACQGMGIDGVQVWDSYWRDCRFDFLGSNDGTVPAVRFACRTSDTVGAMGYSIDNNNQLDFHSCVLESGRGGLWFVRNAGAASGATQSNHTINFRHLHAEQNATAGPYIRFHGTNRSSITESMFYVHTLQGGASAVNAIEVGASGLSAGDIAIRDTHLHGANAANTYRCLVRAESAAGLVLDNVTGDYSGVGRGPTVALVEWVGTNTNVAVRDVKWRNNGDNRPLFSGAPTSFSASALSMPVIAGAGRTALADSDFPNASWDNRVAFVKNTSTGQIRLGVRDAGTWKHVELT